MDKYYWNSDWDKTTQRLEALWENEIVDRACIAIPVTDNKEYEPIVTMSDSLSQEELKKCYTDPETITAQFRQTLEHTKFMGDALPCIFPNFGTCGFIQYAGSTPNYRPDTIWNAPFITEPDENMIQYHPEVFKEHIQIMKELVRLAKDDYFIAMPDHCGILDGLAVMRGTQELLLDLPEEPEFVTNAVRKLMDIQKTVIPGFYDAIWDNNRQGITHAWMHLWSKQKIMQVQCDFSVMISPDYYEEFVLPELIGSAEWADRVAYHFDGQEQIRHLDHILSVDQIGMIQWTPVAGQPPTTNFIPVLQRIQKAGKGLVLILQPWEVEIVMDQLSSKGLRIIVNDVHSEEEAKALIDLVERKTHE